MEDVYAPRTKIAVASSFEGIINNGATECGLTSFNAYQRMDEGRGRLFGRVVEPEDFGSIRESREMQAFLRLRPLVEVAEDYLTVLEVIDANPGPVTEMLNHTDIEASYEPLIERFGSRKSESWELRARFKEAFYNERKRMVERNYTSWLATQIPFPESVAEMRHLVGTQKRDDSGGVESGFIPWFATSKDEQSTFDLCTFYAAIGRLQSDDVSQDEKRQCMITRDRIIGLEHTRDKMEQMIIIARTEGIPRSQVWRLNDRYDKGQQTRLRDEGFAYQFLLAGGYVFPHEVNRAMEDPMVIVLQRKGFAKSLGDYAQKWGF